MRGIFITFEGGEGAGKSTQIKNLAERLKNTGQKVVLSREPGGSPGAEIIRHVLLSGGAQAFGPETEVLMFAAARLDHMRQTILPALQTGCVVLCDRFYDSTRAYQGGGDGVSNDYLKQMEAISVGGNDPDLTIILDIDPVLGMQRVMDRLETANKTTTKKPMQVDRFEKDDLDVHRKRREAFLAIAKEESRRCVVVDASQDPETVSEVIWLFVQQRLEDKGIKIRETM